MLEPTTSSYSNYRFGYNGMERDDEVKEKHTPDGSGRGNSYDYGARFYDPRAARFLSLDPMKEKYVSISAYVYAANNPILLIDIEGLAPKDVTKKALEYVGTPYEYGGRSPIEIGDYPLGLKKNEYLDIVLPGPDNTRATNPNYQSKEKQAKYPVLKNVKYPQSLGIDCAGHAIVSFNSDNDKLMSNFNLMNTNAQGIKDAFIKAEEEKTGFLSNDFSIITEGDLVFTTPNKKGRVGHVMVATGNKRDVKNAKGTIIGTEIEVIDTQETKKEVTSHWRRVKDGWTFGHTNRTTDKKEPIIKERQD